MGDAGISVSFRRYVARGNASTLSRTRSTVEAAATSAVKGQNAALDYAATLIDSLFICFVPSHCSGIVSFVILLTTCRFCGFSEAEI